MGEMSSPPPLGKTRRIGASTGSVSAPVMRKTGWSGGKLSQEHTTDTSTTNE